LIIVNVKGNWLILIGDFIAAHVATLLKAISPYSSDNLTVPIVVAIVLFWLGL
jgi:dolichol kinase